MNSGQKPSTILLLRRQAALVLSLFLLTSLFAVTGSINIRANAEVFDGSGSDQVVAASGNNRFAVWYDGSQGRFDIFFSRSVDNGATWQSPVNLSNNLGESLHPQIAVSGSSVYVTWLQENAAGTQTDVFVKRSNNNGATWGGNVKLSSSGMNFGTLPQIAVSGSNVYIAWHDRDVGDVFFRRSTDNGATWKAIVNISNNAGNSHDPKMFAVGSNVLMMWGDKTPGNEDILFKRSTDNGATWKAVMNLSSNPNDSFPGEIIG